MASTVLKVEPDWGAYVLAHEDVLGHATDEVHVVGVVLRVAPDANPVDRERVVVSLAVVHRTGAELVVVDNGALEVAVAGQRLEDHLAHHVASAAAVHPVQASAHRLLEELLGDAVVDAGDVVGQHALPRRQVVLLDAVH